MDQELARKALQALVDTINATGGIVLADGRVYGCAADEEWLDLADAYMTACQALGVEPVQQEMDNAL